MNTTTSPKHTPDAPLLEVLQRIAAALEKQNELIEAQTRAAEENAQSVMQSIAGVSNRLEDMGRFS